MIWVLLILAIAATIVGVLIMYHYKDSYDISFAEILGGILAVVGGVFVIACFIMAGVQMNNIIQLRVVDNQIAMYQEENENIETQIGDMVKQYQEYETEIFTDVKPESSITLVSLYPELKSDALVQEQIKIHTANNQKIKELKEKKINGSVYRWWLYFGK